MHSFEELSRQFTVAFDAAHFPREPRSLYEPNEYFLKLGGKRVRPALCLMGNEMFDDLHPDVWPVATAIELFHNFTLIHDDIMDKAPLRRGMETVHIRYGESTALLAGDVMLVTCYEYLNKVQPGHQKKLIAIFNKMAREVCEGQQMDMDFEKKAEVSMKEYLHMIELKTSVLLAACLKMGALLGGAGERNQQLLYEFGRKLGIAFQVQDDYLDAFGDPARFGKQVGGDIMSNKKTFLLIHAREVLKEAGRKELDQLMLSKGEDKVAGILKLFRECEADTWALQLKNTYLEEAMTHLEDIAVMSARKQPLLEFARFLVKRDY